LIGVPKEPRLSMLREWFARMFEISRKERSAFEFEGQRRHNNPLFLHNIRHAKSFVGCSNESDRLFIKLILDVFNPKSLQSVEDQNRFLFKFVNDQLQRVQSEKYARPMGGQKRHGVSIGLHDGWDGERTSFYPFDFDPARCLLTGGGTMIEN